MTGKYIDGNLQDLGSILDRLEVPTITRKVILGEPNESEKADYFHDPTYSQKGIKMWDYSENDESFKKRMILNINRMRSDE